MFPVNLREYFSFYFKTDCEEIGFRNIVIEELEVYIKVYNKIYEVFLKYTQKNKTRSSNKHKAFSMFSSLLEAEASVNLI